MALTTHGSVVSELMARGRESAAVLEALLQGGSASAPAHGGIRELAAEILRCCDRALAALHGGGVAVAAAGSDDAGAGVDRKRKSAPGGATADQMRPKRRARVSSGEMPTTVEKKCTAEDGFMWRKYGQKVIMNSKHPRLYFRCTYKHDRGCAAMRQVQQSEDDASLYVITYFGEHTCCGDAAAVGDDGEMQMQPFVINFGSATASSGSPAWLSSSVDDDVRSETSRSSQAVRLPVEDGREELRLKVAKVESTSDSQPAAGPAAELSSSADVSCSSPAWDVPLPGCSDWDYFGESSFDDIFKFINFDEIALFQ